MIDHTKYLDYYFCSLMFKFLSQQTNVIPDNKCYVKDNDFTITINRKLKYHTHVFFWKKQESKRNLVGLLTRVICALIVVSGELKSTEGVLD